MPESGLALSDEDLGLILEGKGTKLADGHKDRDDVIQELAELLAGDPRVVVGKSERLISSGRASFGRQNEGREGLALFVPQDD